ncbi:N-acetylmuramic acid 6-phosphate etherase [Enterococcus rivorum]|uniref:N-acetylmuramic acid 6-phosphate etherase n=1 Tax=Enterococcus rivorum TaxID=762845 RepID=A0A1E5KYS4_9ENTE|nr:N-acetylmuramic acid 6-phosphate etherase [Enterococcus rivorum]MBP2097555.1 N-acetylmuramic acid 6-phosphate etherase [Enterococcus rivorum]OEH83007.1 N-acetylmuramic acid 6-phosphate etherase [Enterococcus rivorum]
MKLEELTTELRNDASMEIDQLSTLDMVKIINNEDRKVAFAVEKVLPDIAAAIDRASERYQTGGRLIYCGAGTSGRLGTLDAIELTPTYSVSPKRAFGIIAGGEGAMFQAVEGAEDSKDLAKTDLKAVKLTSKDVIIAIAASGRTPYAIGAIEYGKEIGALTIAVTCNKNSQMNHLAAIGIAPVVGAEVITGSTRMKAGTAQKMVLNMLSTGIMVKAGKVYQNLMVNVQPTNEKLVQRSINIICEATKVDALVAKKYLEKAENHVPEAIVMIKTNTDLEHAKKLLTQYQYKISDILANEN